MRTGFDPPTGARPNISLATRPAAPAPPNLRDAPAVAELFVGVFHRDLLIFFPRARFDPIPGATVYDPRRGPDFRRIAGPVGGPIEIEMFGARYRIGPPSGTGFSSQDVRLIEAMGAVLSLRYHHAFQISGTDRLELYRGGSEDHYVAAFIDPAAYAVGSSRPSRIAATILTLRMAALSTYENQRVSTGALLVGPGEAASRTSRPTPLDALPYGAELTGLKCLHRLCDGKRTLFLVDTAGRLAEIIDVNHRAAEVSDPDEVPCAREYQAHARATRAGGHVCLVLSPNQEIKLFAGGVQAFTFAHGHWRILDPVIKYSVWLAAVSDPILARALFQAALNLAEERRGALFVVVHDPAAYERLISPHDLLRPDRNPSGPPPELDPRDPLAKRALHYLARDRDAGRLDSTVLEALASLDGALVVDAAGRVLAFGAILRHDTGFRPGLIAEGARTTAALVASRFGPVLKVSQDGIVSCYLQGAHTWDL